MAPAPTLPIAFKVDLIPVVSSNVAAIGWQQNQLFVKFNNGGEYKYSNVPERVFHDMLAADSKGQFLYEHIKGKFPYTKVRIQNIHIEEE